MGDPSLSRRTPQGTDDDGGWSHVAMRWMGRLTQIVEVSILWFVATLAGGVILGWLPSTVAAGDVLHRLLTSDPSQRPIADFFTVWRAQFGRANAVGWPATLAGLVLALDVWILLGFRGEWVGYALAGTLIVAGWLAVGVGYLTNLLALPGGREASAVDLWRAALTMPLVSAGYTVTWLVCVASLAVVVWVFPVVGVLAAPGLLVLLTAWLARRRLRETGVADDPRQS